MHLGVDPLRQPPHEVGRIGLDQTLRLLRRLVDAHALAQVQAEPREFVGTAWVLTVPELGHGLGRVAQSPAAVRILRPPAARGFPPRGRRNLAGQARATGVGDGPGLGIRCGSGIAHDR